MAKQKKSQFKILGLFTFTLALFICCFVFVYWLYHGRLTPTKIKIFNILPLPMAIVGGKPVPMSEFEFRSRLNLALLGDNAVSQSQVYQSLISETQTAVLAATEGVSVNAKAVDQEFALRAQSADLEGQKNFLDLLSAYGISQTNYKLEIIKPGLLLNNLQIWYNSNKQLNPQAYNLADNLEKKIQTGEDMALLAAAFSDDPLGKNTGGDLGFIDTAELLPELREPIANLKVGELRIFPGRDGLHLIRLESLNGNLLELRQIFLKISGFQNWRDSQISRYNIYNFASNLN